MAELISCEEYYNENSAEAEALEFDQQIIRVKALTVVASFFCMWADCEVWLGIDGKYYGVA